MTEQIGILGGGSWGTALGILLANKGYDVTIWLRDKYQVEEINNTRINNKYLPDVVLPPNLKVSNDLEYSISNKKALVLSMSTHGIRDVLSKAYSYIKPNQIIINVSKGIESETLLRISQIVEEFLPENTYVVLSGPSHAEEVSKNMPTTVVSASRDKLAAEYVQDLFFTSTFRVYTNPDVIGVELGGALKNIIALGAGISDGLNYGDNTKAALMTRGIIEIARLGEKMGANINTFSGLAGIGDLIVTCTSMHSRNRRAGILIGQGIKVDEAIRQIGMVVEGIRTTKSAYNLAQKYNIEMPITSEIYGVLYEGKDVKNSVLNLMIRDKKNELEDIIKDKNNTW
ncbi:MAG: NAD(P)H-dependent glycerol-3-phosphate dehydrogenase [Tissierellia bacterium]|nr:NAD(P)H-dependent glycerol-3-phosphate dehydrogenase [Tissierellia bacterium]